MYILFYILCSCIWYLVYGVLQEDMSFSTTETLVNDNFIGWITTPDKSDIVGALTTGIKY